MPFIILVALAFLVLTILVVVHELGHFIAAKKAGVWVEEFGVGLPPRIWGKKIGGTIYSINLLPLGGFVRLHGETEEGEIAKPNKAFVNKSAKARIIISLAGIFMNVLFALICFSAVYSFKGIPQERDLGYVKVFEVVDGSTAKDAGISTGDIIRKVDGKEVLTTENFISTISEKKGRKVRIEVDRVQEGETKRLTYYVTPQEDQTDKKVRIGVVISTKEATVYYPPLYKRPFVSAVQGVKDTFFLTNEIVKGLFGIASNISRGEAPKDVGGPVTIIALLTEVIKKGFFDTLFFAGAISLNLAIFNLLPFPPLDGSRVLFVGVEKVLGKKMVPNIESKIHTIGFIILMALVVLLSAREIPNLIQAGSVTGFVDSLLK